MGFNNIKGMIDAELSGKVRRYFWRKTITPATTTGLWFDLSMSSGNPPAKYWFDSTPMTAKQIKQSTDGGIFHGPNVSPSTKYLRTMTTICHSGSIGLPMTMYLLDYLLYYPTIDESITGSQSFDNTETLPRYTDGDGVQVIAVSLASRTGGQSFNFSYTNQDGVSGRTSQTVVQNTATATGHIVTSGTATLNSANPFIGLQLGDTGVRSIESVNMLGADVGLFALILVRPLAQTAVVGTQMTTAGTSTVFEKDFFIHSGVLPIIQDDAYLSTLIVGTNTLAGVILSGDLKVIWD